MSCLLLSTREWPRRVVGLGLRGRGGGSFRLAWDAGTQQQHASMYYFRPGWRLGYRYVLLLAAHSRCLLGTKTSLDRTLLSVEHIVFNASQKKKPIHTEKQRRHSLYHTRHTLPRRLLYPHVTLTLTVFSSSSKRLDSLVSEAVATQQRSLTASRCNSGIEGMQRFVCATRGGMTLLLSYRSGIGPKGGGE